MVDNTLTGYNVNYWASDAVKPTYMPNLVIMILSLILSTSIVQYLRSVALNPRA